MHSACDHYDGTHALIFKDEAGKLAGMSLPYDIHAVFISHDEDRRGPGHRKAWRHAAQLLAYAQDAPFSRRRGCLRSCLGVESMISVSQYGPLSQLELAHLFAVSAGNWCVHQNRISRRLVHALPFSIASWRNQILLSPYFLHLSAGPIVTAIPNSPRIWRGPLQRCRSLLSHFDAIRTWLVFCCYCIYLYIRFFNCQAHFATSQACRTFTARLRLLGHLLAMSRLCRRHGGWCCSPAVHAESRPSAT